MAKLADKKIGQTYGDLVTVEADPVNSGMNSDLQYITDGNNARSPLRLSLTKAQVKPSTNSTDTFECKRANGNSALKVDTTNNIVTAGNHSANVLGRQEVFYFAGGYSNIVANTWYSMSHGGGFFSTGLGTVSSSGNTHASLGNTYGTGATPTDDNDNDTDENTLYKGHYFNLDSFRCTQRMSLDSVTIQYLGRYIDGSGNQTLPIIKCQIWRYKSQDSFGGQLGGYNGGELMASHSGSLQCLFTEKTKTLSIDSGDVNDVGAPYVIIVPMIRVETVGNVDAMVKMYMNYHLQ